MKNFLLAAIIMLAAAGSIFSQKKLIAFSSDATSNDKQEIFVMDEMKSLYDWWHNDYGKEYQRKCDEIWEEVETCRPEYYFRKIESHPQARGHENYYKYDPKFKTQENRTKYKDLLKKVNQIEQEYEEQLQTNLHRLVNIIPYLWT